MGSLKITPVRVLAIIKKVVSEPFRDKTRKEVLRGIWNRYGVFLIFFGWIAVMSLLSQHFLTIRNLTNVARQVTPLGLISLGLLLVIILGYVDLTVGAFLGLSGALFAGFSKVYGVWPALFFVFAVAVFVGCANGYLSTRGKGISIIVTLSSMSIIYGTTLLYTQGRPVIKFPTTLRFLGAGYVGLVPWPVIILCVISVFTYFFLDKTLHGQRFYAIGGNPEAARRSGMNVSAYVVLGFMMSALYSFVAGLVLVQRIYSAQPNAGQGEELNAAGAVLIGGASLGGGKGTVLRTLAGVFIIGTISNGLNLMHVNPFFQYVAKGAIILFAVLMDQWGKK